MAAEKALVTVAVFAFLVSSATASTILYVNGVTGTDSNSCTSTANACKTIGHAISLGLAGDVIRVSAGIYVENLTIATGLNLVGSGAQKTIIDGGARGTVVAIPNAAAHVTISGLTIRNGRARPAGGGILNNGTLIISQVTVTQNTAYNTCPIIINCGSVGGGISNSGRLTANGSTVSNNNAIASFSCSHGCTSIGGGIENTGIMVINNSTIAGNGARVAGAISNANTTPSSLSINSSTIAGNISGMCCMGAVAGVFTTQNSIFANIDNANTDENCGSTPPVSKGYNLSSDSTCALSGPGDMNNTDPMLGQLQGNGGPTQTMALASGSPAVDAGNPSGCTNAAGHLLKTDQRGWPRPDQDGVGGCDIGAYEFQGH